MSKVAIVGGSAPPAVGVGDQNPKETLEEFKAVIDLVPVFDRIFIRRKMLERIGSIIVPNDPRLRELDEGEVISVGPDCGIIKPGSEVVFGKYAGTQLDRNGRKFTIMNECDIIGQEPQKED